ncbi:MAG: hypothetical protein AAF725_08605, partial [Acidobacteriota bacterium]
NPFFGPWIAAHVTGRSYWRSLWALPVPLLLTLIAVAPLIGRGGFLAARSPGWPLSRAPGIAIFAVLGAWWVAALGEVPHGLSEGNRVRLGRPALKVPEPEYRWAALADGALPAGSRVAAPRDVAAWLPTFHRPVYPLIVRGYLERHVGRALSRAEIVRRRRIGLLLDDPQLPHAAAALRRQLEIDPEIDAAVLPVRPGSEALSEALEAAGFRKLELAEDGGDVEIWRRESQEAPAP